ncbi:MAG: hypothetical protein ABEK59_07370 [Halobacteria archaeon]
MRVIAPGPNEYQELVNPPGWLRREIIQKWWFLVKNYDWLQSVADHKIKTIKGYKIEVVPEGKEVVIFILSIEDRQGEFGLLYPCNAVSRESLNFKELAQLTQEERNEISYP